MFFPLMIRYAEPGDFPASERILLGILIVASVLAFWARFRKVWAEILSAKGDYAFSLRPIGTRVRDFVLEVMFQSKVIRQRPLPGIAHAFVFWGFCAFSLITINHLSTGFGLPLISAEGTTGKVYVGFVALFALAVSLAITALFIRRFIARPEWLGQHLSIGSGIVALLILTLMVTYLNAFLLLDPSRVKANWWVHTLALLIFLPLIPHTKHLHLILSPLTVFLSRGSFSAIPPLAGDEDFGLVQGKDITKLTALQAYSCVECGRCMEHCPAANTRKSLNPKDVILGLRQYLNHFGARSDEPLLGRYNSKEAVFQCTTCGACEFQCPVGIEHLPIIIGLRRGAVNTGDWDDEYGAKLFLKLERYGNVLGLSSTERDKFIQKHNLPVYDGSQEYCLWTGCMGAYDPAGRDIVLSLARIMRHIGISYGVLRKEKCTGDAARRLGNDLLFQQLAQQNLEALRAAKVAKMISVCPHCVRTISTDWREFGETPAIEHHTEFLARHASRLPAGANGTRIAYHDPCYLGRYRGVYESPRGVLAQYGSVLEAERSGERSFCCGAGGGLALLGEERGDRVSHVRARQLAETGAAVLGAACPFCNTMLRDAAAAVSDRPIQVLDIAQIAAMSLGGNKQSETTGVPA